ncbi:MAG: hypothetical protein CMN20_11825 [Roseovarius sp.]|nr:hypothetical protein [Roseovarius sp.]
MRLSERLVEPVRLGRLELGPPALIEAAVKSIRERWPDLPRLPAEADREKVLRRFALRVQNDTWEGCTLAEAARALHIACLPEFRQPIYQKALRLLLDEVRNQRRPLLVSAALAAYLETWEQDNTYTRALAQRLSRLTPRDFPARWRRIVSGFPGLFDPGAIHRDVAERMAAADDPWADLRDLGVPDPHGPGLWAAAQGEWLKRIAQTLTKEDGIERLLRWLRPDATRLALPPARAAAVIEALIRAWGERMPPEGLVDRITGRLSDLYGDPRLNMAAPWGAMDRGVLEAYRRWLTGANLRLFLDVITEAERRYTRAEESHMWAPRRKFWLGLYEQGRIREAWPAFSPEAALVARDMLGRRNLRLDHGRQTGRSNNTSILIMRIGDKVVVEGSHNYKVHVFCASARSAPSLYGRSYDCDDIRLTPKHGEVVHRGDWQDRVRWEIERPC